MNHSTGFASDLSVFKEEWLPLEYAIQKVAKFEHDFGKAHLSFACHASLVSILTPELANLIRINFLEQSVEWIAESDFLLSSLCNPIDQGIFEVEPQIRQILLMVLQEDPAYGPERLGQIAYLLHSYIESPLANHLPLSIKRIYQWISSAYIDPDITIQNMADFLKETTLEETASRTANYQQVGKALALIASPLEATNLQVELEDLADSAYLVVQGYVGTATLHTVLQNNRDTFDETLQPLTTSVIDWLLRSPTTNDEHVMTRSLPSTTSGEKNKLHQMLTGAGMSKETIALLQEAFTHIPVDEELSRLYQRCADMLERSSRIDEAVALLHYGIMHLPVNKGLGKLYQCCAEMLKRVGRMDKAITLLQEGSTRVPDDKELFRLYQQFISSPKPVRIFCVYAPADKIFLNKLADHLLPLQRAGLITFWHDQIVSPGKVWRDEIDNALNAAQIILLLLSADLFASHHFIPLEQKILKKHQKDKTRIIPILLRPVVQKFSPIAHLQWLPRDQIPIMSQANIDKALIEVTIEIEQVVKELHQLFSSEKIPVKTLLSSVNIFCVYIDTDRKLQMVLERHLRPLKQQGLISEWHDRQVTSETHWEYKIDEHIARAQLILLLISPDFLASSYCSSIEMKRVIERHRTGKAKVFLVMLRQVASLQHTPFIGLPSLPVAARPVIMWKDREAAFANIASDIQHTIKNLSLQKVDSFYTNPSVYWNIPYPRNSFFIGRDKIFDLLYNQFHGKQTRTLPLISAISGLGGMGKTQIAIEYAYRYRSEYQAVLWVRADSQEAIIASYQDIATLLNLPVVDGQDSREVVYRVKSWSQSQANWLLIFDGADELDLIEEFLPPIFQGHILITTCASAVGKLEPAIYVDALSLEESATFLLQRANLLALGAYRDQVSANDWRAAIWISQELGQLPLALDQAGAYIEETAISPEEFISLYRKHRYTILNRRGHANTGHLTTVATTWLLSFEAVEQRNAVAADLLRLCAYLASENIPEEIITRGAAHLGSRLASAATNPLKLDQTFASLLAFSLLHRDPTSRTLSIHPLVQVIIQESLPQETSKLWISRAIRAVNEAFVESDFVQRTEYKRYIPHILVCVHWIERKQMNFPEAALLLRKMGIYLRVRAQYSESESLLKMSLNIQERIYGSKHSETATTLNNLATLYQDQRRYAEAEMLFEQALMIHEQVLDPTHPTIKASLNNLAILYENQDRYAEAEMLFERALAICEQTLGSSHPDTARSLNNLGTLYRSQGRYAEGEMLFERALAICEQTLGPSHPDTAKTLNNLAELYRKQIRHKDAEPLYKRAIAICEQTLGPTHLHTAQSLSNLALLYESQGRYAEAEPLFKRASGILNSTADQSRRSDRPHEQRG